MKKRLENIWYYYKVPVIIVLVVLAVTVYFLTLGKTPASDYSVAFVSPRGWSEEQLSQIRKVFEAAGTDQTGDGAVTVNLRLFRFAVGEDGQDMKEIAGLDADLVGKESGLFFTEDPEGFEAVTNGIVKAADAVSVSDTAKFAGCGIDDMYFLMRGDADRKYALLLSALKE